MRIVHIQHKASDEDQKGFGGLLLGPEWFDTLIQEDADVYKPDGKPLLKYRKDVLPADACFQAWQSLRHAAQESSNRGTAAGAGDDGAVIRKSRGLKRDGTVSRTTIAASGNVESGIVGYFDRNPRFPYCRMTAFNIDHHKEFQAAMPFVRAVDRVFAENAPDRYAAQLAKVQQTSPDFYIQGTVFTTITVNRNFRTAVHKDAGDLKEGFGVMSVLQAGQYEGGYLCFPAFRVAVDMRTRGVCLADVHEWHGNTPITGKRYERISCIFYYRANMEYCESAAAELERAKRRREGDKLNA